MTAAYRLLASLLLLLCCVVTAHAGERRIALVLGNGAYQHAPALPNPANDARTMAEVLRRAGFELVGGGARIDLAKDELEQAIRSFGAKLPGADVSLFYYAGHGLQVRGTNFLVPVSANLTKEADVRYELVDVNLILEEMMLAESRLNILILDACRNNPFAGRGLRAASSGLAQMQAPAGTIVAYATQPGSVAADGEGNNSPYTEALSRAILKPGETVFDVFNEVGVTVKRLTAGAQQPWVSTSPIEGRFYFFGPTTVVTAPAPAPATPDKDALFWDSIKASNSPALYDAYLQQFPQGTFAPIARAKLAELAPAPVAAPVAVPVAAPAQPPALVRTAPVPLANKLLAMLPPDDEAPAPSVGSVKAALVRSFDAAAIPYVPAKSRDALARYAGLSSPKALAISEAGGYAYTSNGKGDRTEADVKRSALQRCQHVAGAPCTLYALNDTVLLEEDAAFVPMPVEIPGRGVFDPARVPFVSDRTRDVGMASYALSPGEKALALGPSGRWAAVWNRPSSAEAQEAALDRCNQQSDESCIIYAVNDTVVFDSVR